MTKLLYGVVDWRSYRAVGGFPSSDRTFLAFWRRRSFSGFAPNFSASTELVVCWVHIEAAYDAGGMVVLAVYSHDVKVMVYRLEPCLCLCRSCM
jgi:hypothetical protein